MSIQTATLLDLSETVVSSPSHTNDMCSQQPATFAMQPFSIDTLINLFLSRMFSCIRFEIKLKNTFSSSLSKVTGQTLSMVEGIRRDYFRNEHLLI